MKNNFNNFRIMAKICLAFLFALFVVQIAGRILLLLKKMKSGEDNDELGQLIKKILKLFKTEIFIPTVFYMLNISIGSFCLGSLILFILGLAGIGLLVFGEISGAKEGTGKLLNDIGKALLHVSTFVMIIVMTARVDYIYFLPHSWLTSGE